jgi:hypothetical protein
MDNRLWVPQMCAENVRGKKLDRCCNVRGSIFRETFKFPWVNTKVGNYGFRRQMCKKQCALEFELDENFDSHGRMPLGSNWRDFVIIQFNIYIL